MDGFSYTRAGESFAFTVEDDGCVFAGDVAFEEILLMEC